MKITSTQFLNKLAKCEACFAATMPGTAVRISKVEAAYWLGESWDDSTYKPTVYFANTPTGMRCVVGMPMGHGTEVTP